MLRTQPKPITSESLKAGPRHQYSKLLGLKKSVTVILMLSFLHVLGHRVSFSGLMICIINNLCWLLTELIGVNEVRDQQMMLPCQITLFYSVGSTVMPQLIQRTRLQLLWNTISSTKKATQNTGLVGYHCAQKKSYADNIKMISHAS